MNQDNPFIGVSIQRTTTTAQVSSSPAERPPYFSFASRSAIDCQDGPPGAAGLIDSGAARHRSSSLLYPPGVRGGPIHPGPISEPYPFFFCQTREMNMPFGFAIVEIVGSRAAAAFKPFLRALRQESTQVHALPKNEGENTLQKRRQRGHSANEQASGGSGDLQLSQTGSEHQEELIRTLPFLNVALPPFPTKRQLRLQHRFSSASRGPVRPLATHKQVMLKLTVAKR